jgi:succinyl-diaminopimelate desuccinylase
LGVRPDRRGARIDRLTDPDVLHEAAANELLALVAIGSHSGQEHEAVAYLAARCEAWELPVRRLPVDGAADDLVIGWSERPSLLLTAHVDTVVPAWSWSARREGADIVGLGAGDCKGSVVAFLLGMLIARERGVDLARLPVAVGICVDEEELGRGSIVMADAIGPRHVIAGEPSRLAIGVAEAGFVDVRLDVRGTAVHGAFAELGDNAIEKAARLVLAVHDEPFATQEHPILGRGVPSVMRFEGGSELHVIPDRATLRLEVRVVPGERSAAQIEARVRELAEAYDADVELVEESVEPFETPRDAPVLAALQAAVERETGAPATEVGVPAWTDAHNFVDRSGSQAVVWGPGDFELAHHPDERIAVDDVASAARVVASLLEDAGAWLT